MKPITHILCLTTILALSLDKALCAKPIPISPQDFTIKACEFAGNVQACKTVVSSIIGGIPHDVELDESNIALETVERVQERYREVALALNDMIEANAKNEKLKAALLGCYKMYMDIAHESHIATMHLKQKSEVCKVQDFAMSADANPKICEESLVHAGTTGEKLGLYKDYKDLIALSGACNSVISYLIKAYHFKAKDCSKN